MAFTPGSLQPGGRTGHATDNDSIEKDAASAGMGAVNSGLQQMMANSEQQVAALGGAATTTDQQASAAIVAREELLDTDINLTEEQVYDVISKNGVNFHPPSHSANKIAISNTLLGMYMGLSFEEANDRTIDGGFYTMLREGYADADNFGTPYTQITSEKLNTVGGKLKYLQNLFHSSTSGVIGSGVDNRDWLKAVTSGKPIKGLQVATNQMYGGISVNYMSAGFVKDDEGNDTDVPLEARPYLVGGNGVLL